MPELKESFVLEGNKGLVWCVSWHPDGKFLASCGNDLEIRLWMFESKQINSQWTCVSVLKDEHTKSIRSVCWSPSGKYLASASFDGIVGIWNRNAFDFVATLEGHENEVKRVCFNFDESLVATCSRDKTVWIWKLEEDNEFECISILQEHTHDVKCVRWHPTLTVLVSAGYDNEIKFYSEGKEDWECYSTLKGHCSTVWDVCFNSDGNFLASCSEDKNIHLWSSSDLEHPKINERPQYNLVWTIENIHHFCVYSLSWRKDDKYLASASRDNYVRIFKTELSRNNEIKVTLKVEANNHQRDVNCVEWNPNVSNLLASCGDDKKIRLWEFIE